MGGRHDVCNYGTSFSAKTWRSLDPCGCAGICLSGSVHVFALFVNATKTVPDSWLAAFIFFGLYIPTALLALTSLYMAWSTDPGAVPLGARPLTIVRRATSTSQEEAALQQERGLRRCPKCHDNYKPTRAHHDSVTGRCIVKFDHYCPWVGNAVGALNHKFFCLFLLYTAATCVQSLLLILLRWVQCGFMMRIPGEKVPQRDSSTNAQHYDPNNHDRALLEDQHVIYPGCEHLYDYHLFMALLVASLVFLVFTCSMGCEQIEAIATGQGKIARMKLRNSSRGGGSGENVNDDFNQVTQEFNEMFGGTSPQVSWHWFWPRPVEFPRGMRQIVLGYEWDVSFAPEAYNVDGGGGTGGGHELMALEAGRRQQRLTHEGPASDSRHTSSPLPSSPTGGTVVMRKSSSSVTDESESLVDRSGTKLS